jgi:hypothetical protein
MEDTIMAHTPIIHGNPTNETPAKCLKCANRVYHDGKYICAKNESGKFVGTLGYSCFKYPEKKKD